MHFISVCRRPGASHVTGAGLPKDQLEVIMGHANPFSVCLREARPIKKFTNNEIIEAITARFWANPCYAVARHGCW